MKLRIDIDENFEEIEVVIKTARIDEIVKKLQKEIADITSEKKRFVFYKNDTEYYFSLDNILFFETSDNCISAHTVDDVFQVKYRLYELEELLPGYFIRVSKSTILNVSHIYSITHNLSSSSLVQFNDTHKQVYVSRNYYKQLKSKLIEKRNV